MPIATTLRRLKVYFTANFHSSDFAYVLHPFLRIFKIFGFAPVQLKGGDILRSTREELNWDATAGVWALIGAICYMVGFTMGAHHLSMTENWAKLHQSTVITYFTSWVQIVMLFVLGAVAVFTSWTNMTDFRHLFILLFKIDQGLKSIADIKIDYTPLRQRLFVEFFVVFLVPVSLSMVNCIIIQPAEESFSVISSCFWFICFVPILLLTLKEFQFYNLLFILKSKFDIVNERLKVYGNQGSRQQKVLIVRKMQSISEIPLTAITPTQEHASTETLEKPNIETLQKLLQVYSNISDAVELVLKIFAWHLLLMTTVSFGVITIQSYNLFALMVHSLEMQVYQVIFVIAWILIQIATIAINVSACGMTAKAMSATGPLLHKIQLPLLPSEPSSLFYQLLQLFSLEVLQRKNNFTAAGFFNMDYKLITSIIAAVTTYLVIIIQFHLTNMTDQHLQSPPG